MEKVSENEKLNRVVKIGKENSEPSGEITDGVEAIPIEKSVKKNDVVVISTRGICGKCGKEKPRWDFYVTKKYKNGLSKWCKECIYKISTQEPEPMDADERSKAIEMVVMCIVEDPNAKLADIRRKTGLRRGQIQEVFGSNPYLKTLKRVATRRVTLMIPEAVKALLQSIKQSDSTEVKFKAAVKVLENEDVLGPNKIDVTVNDLRSKSDAELRKIIEEAQQIPSQTIEAELIG